MFVACSLWLEGCHHHVVGVGHEEKSVQGIDGGGWFWFSTLDPWVLGSYPFWKIQPTPSHKINIFSTKNFKFS